MGLLARIRARALLDGIAREQTLEEEHLEGEHRWIRRQGCRLCHELDRIAPAGADPDRARVRWDAAAGGFVPVKPEELP